MEGEQMEQPRSLSEPRREMPLAHQCVCLLVSPSGMSGVHDKCKNMVDDPDSPFCSSCEASGHPDSPYLTAEMRRP